jgi:hypothetical protein
MLYSCIWAVERTTAIIEMDSAALEKNRMKRMKREGMVLYLY